MADSDMHEQRIVYTLPHMDEAQRQTGIVYKHVADIELRLDVYTPPTLPPGERRPAILFVHGEPWTQAAVSLDVRHWGQYISWGQLAAAAGWVGIPFEHRISQACTHLSEAADDIADLIHFARTQIPTVDPERIVLWICSGGGAYGLSAALHEHAPAIRCAVLYYPFLEPACQRALIPAEISDDLLDHYTPRSHLARHPEQVPPLLLVRAGLDHAMLNVTIDRFVAEGLRQNIALDVINYAEGQHGFDTLDDTDRSRAIIAQTLAFIRFHVEK